MTTASTKSAFPAGLNNAYSFALFNALSFQVVLSSPMVLYAKTLHANATVLGLLTGMMPLLVIFQIPAAAYIEAVGYKRFVFAGWGTRVSLIFVMALVPLTGNFLNVGSQLALILALLFGFDLSRGISSCAWLPWISSLVPAEVRGRYLAREAACVSLGSSLSFWLAALCLGARPAPWQFALLFAFSAAMGAVSLVFLKRIPDRPPDPDPSDPTKPGALTDAVGSRRDEPTTADPSGRTVATLHPETLTAATARAPVSGSKEPVPWGAMLRYAPFQKLLCMIVAWSVAYGGITAFTVVYLKSAAGMAENQILCATAISYLGGLASLWFLGTRLDGLGSKPVLTFSFAVWIVILIGWAGLAGGSFSPRFALVTGLQLLMGLFGAMVTTSNTRLAMVLIPVMGRTHFFALYSVIGSVTLGISPIGWGLLLDALGDFHVAAFGLEWNRFTIFFTSVAVAMAVATILARRLEEPQAAGLDHLLREILIQSPQRVLVRLWPRG
ncbi:MAG TPA: MFS transporter [Verrucomicrobiae bacterium]|nr:MFS transporter [Verrucomicrobiae bacterium]